ncbi:MAG: Glu-tRNA(Gln) amidotransferase subunit GatD [Nanoarchaeota archaeon]|nr:Glu-tRNA(Gln) amidotransferase subunit GatD [Nanoarchaeota archaeon]
MANPGDLVKVVTSDKEFSGTLMPTKSDTTLFLKLENGYNLGIDKKKVKEVKTIKTTAPVRKESHSVKPRKGLKNIVILYTGGTIASKVDYTTGGVVAQSGADELLQFVPELKDIANVTTDRVCNVMSEDMSFAEYAQIIQGIQKHLDKDGIIIGHGTDTLTYTAAALAFALENLHLPILVIGSQRSSDRASSDAAMHLICASQFIAKTDFKGVAICMHHSSNDDVCAILPATKSRKMHTSRRDAFKAINSEPLALVDEKGTVKWISAHAAPEGKLWVREKFSPKAALLKMTPNFDTEMLEFATKRYDGIIVEATGLGNMPTNTPGNQDKYLMLEQYIKKGGIVGIASQCLNGRVHGTSYTNLRRLLNIGCVFCEDMLPETAYIKLAWLLGNFKKEDAQSLLAKNLRGEITDRSPYQEELME